MTAFTLGKTPGEANTSVTILCLFSQMPKKEVKVRVSGLQLLTRTGMTHVVSALPDGPSAGSRKA